MTTRDPAKTLAPGDTPGDWTYQMLVDGRSAFDARIRVLAGE